MITDSLTAQRITLDDGLAYPYPWNGEAVLVRNDAKTVLDVISLFADDEISEDAKQEIFPDLFFVDAREAFFACQYDTQSFTDLVIKSVWDICGLDLSGEEASEEPLWDIEQDAAIIRTSFRQAYGVEWDEIRSKIPFAEFISMIGSIPHETPLGRAIYYRNPDTKPKPTKHNPRKEEIAEWHRLNRAFALKKAKRSQTNIKAQNAAMIDDFAALKQAAR